MRTYRTAALLLLQLAAGASRADFFDEYLVDPQDGKLDASRYLSEVPLGFLPVPTIITEPAVGYGFGLGVLFFHETPEQRKQRTEQGVLLPSSISIVGAGATENGTWAGAVGHLGFWRKDSVRYRGIVGFGSVDLDFYSIPGIGDLPRPVELELEGPAVFLDLRFRLPNSKVFLGLRQLYRKVEGAFADPPDLPSLPPAVTDYLAQFVGNDITTSGLGVIAEFDSRDNPFNPQRGYYYSANYTFFDGAFGSDVDFDSLIFKALNYWVLNGRFNLALRFEYDSVYAPDDERLPTYVPPFIDLRGVPKARYQGNRVIEAEVEVDYKLNERWKFGLFTGRGRAAESISEFSEAEDVYSYGTGFRYLVARRYGFVMGADVAKGPEEWAFYIQAGSTWK